MERKNEKENENSSVEFPETKIHISESEQYFINKLNHSLDAIRKESWNAKTTNLIDNPDYLYSNSPVLSVYNSDEENDCFDDITDYDPKQSFHKLTYQDIKRSLDKYYEFEDKYSDELDLLTIYLNGQKNMYHQAKNVTQYKLNCLMFPCIIGSSAISFFAPFIRHYNWSGIFIASINAIITICLSIIHYLKLESLIDSYTQLIEHYDKLENSLQMTTSKLFFMEDKKDKNENIVKKIEEYDTKMNEIKSNINVVVPIEIKNLFPIIYHIHIFSFIKRIETYKRNLMMKFKDIKNEINYIVWKYSTPISISNMQSVSFLPPENSLQVSVQKSKPIMNQRVKNRLEFISEVKVKLKEELLYYKKAYGVMEELFVREIKQNDSFGFWKYFIRKKKPSLIDVNPVIDNYLMSIFVDD